MARLVEISRTMKRGGSAGAFARLCDDDDSGSGLPLVKKPQ